MLRNRAQVTSWKEHLIVTRGTPGWLKHAACMQVCSSRADFQVFTICSSVELAQICVRLRGEGCNPFCTYEHLVSALTWRQWGFFMWWSNTEEKTISDIDKEKVGDLELEILGSGVEVWQLECNLLIYVSHVRNVLCCLQAWTLLTCQSADLRVHVWGCVVECAFPFDVLLPWELHFCPTNGRCSQQRCESRNLYATKIDFLLWKMCPVCGSTPQPSETVVLPVSISKDQFLICSSM